MHNCCEMTSVGLLAALLAALISCSAASLSFEEFIHLHSKSYSSAEEWNRRRDIFARNALIIAAHPVNSSFTIGFTPFADMTVEEFRSVVLGERAKSHFRSTSSSLSGQGPITLSPLSLPPSVDWDAKGLVSPVKNVQCSAVVDEFSGAIESGASIAVGGKLRLLDESQFDCAGCGCSCQISDVCSYA